LAPSSQRIVPPPLHPGQLEVARHPARFKVLAAGRRWGKTSLGVERCFERSVRGGRAWWVAPTYPLASIGWKVARHLARQIPQAEAHESERLIEFPGHGEFQVKSADNPDSLRGAGLDGVVLDEAAYVKEEAWTEALRPALADRRGWALFISSPNGYNWFHTLFVAAATLDGWARWQRPTWDNPRIAQEELDHAREQMGELVFRQEFGAEFLDFGTLKPFRAEWIRYWRRDGEPGPPATGAQTVIEAGFDPAISQRDTAARSALVVACQSRAMESRGRIFVLHAEAGHWSVWEQVDRLLKAVVRWNIRRLRIEKVAYQAALKDLLDREARTRGIAVTVELIAPDGDKLRRANAWSPFVEDGTVMFGPGQQDLVDSMLAVPHDATKWDLVDAAGICIRGFRALEAARDRLEGYEQSTPALAESYSGHAMPQTALPRHRGGSPFRPRVSSALDRAKGYSGRWPGALKKRR
jgi:predicted phage terminase large subunit-like protein